MQTFSAGCKMNMKYFADEFVKLFPEYKLEYEEHIIDYNKILGHVFLVMQ